MFIKIFILGIGGGLLAPLVVVLLVAFFLLFFSKKIKTQRDPRIVFHHLALNEPVEVIEINDVPQDQIPHQESIIKHMISVEAAKNENELIFETNFLIHNHKSLGQKLHGVYGIAFARNESYYPPEFDDEKAQKFSLKKAPNYLWRDILPDIKKVIIDHFCGDVSFSGYTGEENEPLNINV